MDNEEITPSGKNNYSSFNYDRLLNDSKVKNEARGFKILTKNVVQALTEHIKAISLDNVDDEGDLQKKEWDKKQAALWKPLATLPGVTEPLIIPQRKLNLEQLIRNLDRNVQNLHIKQDFSESSDKKIVRDPTLRQKKIIANIVNMINRMADKRKRDILREEFQKSFKRKDLPGEKSVSLGVFLNQTRNNSVSIPNSKQQVLKLNIQQSESNLKAVNTGKKLSTVFDKTDFTPNEDDKNAGLPVFRNRNYSTDLQHLINCPDLKQSFDIQKYSPKFDSVFGALKLSKKLTEDDLELKSKAFVTSLNTVTNSSRRGSLSIFANTKSVQRINEPNRIPTPTNPTIKKASYEQLNSQLKYPVNPAYFPRNRSKNNIIEDQTLLQYCREHRIPFNEADKLLYNIQKCTENFEIFKVLLDQVTSKPGEKFEAIKLPNGKLHLGWPSRMDTPQQMIKDFSESNGYEEVQTITSPLLSPDKTSKSSALNSQPGMRRKISTIRVKPQKLNFIAEYDKQEKKNTNTLQTLDKVLDNNEVRESEMAKIDLILLPNKQKTSLVHEVKVLDKYDSVVKMLETCKNINKTRTQNQINLDKLIHRINLDRPIMQKEKIQLIIFEKSNEESKKCSGTANQLKEVQDRRKIENKRNINAYFKLVQYMSDRSKAINAVLPNQLEISVLEVFKKLTESGWIVKLPEFLQILDFVGIDFVRTSPRDHNQEIRKFIKKFAEEIGIRSNDMHKIIGQNQENQDKQYKTEVLSEIINNY